MKLKIPKKAVIIGASVLAVAGIGTGIFAVAAKGGSKPVYVYSFDICGMTDYWGDQQSTSGLVRATTSRRLCSPTPRPSPAWRSNRGTM